jgi:hypothetical protein
LNQLAVSGRCCHKVAFSFGVRFLKFNLFFVVKPPPNKILKTAGNNIKTVIKLICLQTFLSLGRMAALVFLSNRNFDLVDVQPLKKKKLFCHFKYSLGCSAQQ